MAFYDACCAKCCWHGKLRTGCIILGLISVLLRIIIYVLLKPNLFKTAFGSDETTFETVVLIFFVIINGGIGTVADILLLLGAVVHNRKCIQLYLPTMCFVWIFEIIFFIILFVLGFHWLEALDSLLFGVFHVWCWFVARRFNQEWTTLMPTVVATEES